MCCSPWGRKESDMTKRLNWSNLLQIFCNEIDIFKYTFTKLVLMCSEIKMNFPLAPCTIPGHCTKESRGFRRQLDLCLPAEL